MGRISGGLNQGLSEWGIIGGLKKGRFKLFKHDLNMEFSEDTKRSRLQRVKKMRFQKGRSGNPTGRPRGAKNKLPRDLADRVLEISADLEKQGKGLLACADKDPKWFFENFLKPLIPKNVLLGSSEQARPLTVKVVFVEGKAHV
jgi:hypothetical protein